MKVHFTKKKAVLIICIVLLLVIAAVPAGYFGYGATLLNPNSDRSIIASVSKLRHGNTVGLGDSASKFWPRNSMATILPCSLTPCRRRTM